MTSTPSYLNPPPHQWPDRDEYAKGGKHVKDGKATQALIFNGCEFREPIDLSKVTFEAGVSFRRCIFHESVNFSGARFRGCAQFWRCVFEKQADFKYAVFERLETGAPGSVFNGEANFSWSRFEQDVDFLWARFEGPVFFWRTNFEQFAKLEATFNSDVVFEGDTRLVVVELAVLRPYYEVFDFLERAGLLSQDNEDDYCAKISSVDDQQALQDGLKSVNFNSDGVDKVMSVLPRLQANMFSASGASFCGAKFAVPRAVMFRNVSLRTCRFVNSNAGQAKFQNVQWDWQPTLLLAARRRSVCDERPASPESKLSLETLRALGTLYNDLRVSHEEAQPSPHFSSQAILQPQIRILIPRYSSCESCGTGFCVAIIADEGASFQKRRFRSPDLTLKGQKVQKSGHFSIEGIHEAGAMRHPVAP